jgi:CRP-like cAMP-binding protein
VRITVYSAAGKEVTFRDLQPGEMFGELAAIDGRPRSANAVAKTDARIGRVSAGQFWELLQEFPKVNAATLTYLCGLVRDLSGRVYQFSAHAVSSRIQAEILRLARLAGPTGNAATISPAPTHAEIASRVNTHREAVTKEISRLAGAGLLARSSGQLTVRDIAALSRMTEENGDE